MENNEWVWEGEIEVDPNETEYVTLDPGVYDFTVVKVERVDADGKFSWAKAGTPGSKLTLRINDPKSGQDVNVFDTIYMSQKGKLKAFWGSIGRYKKGEDRIKTPWTQIEGDEGKCEIYNKISGDKTWTNVKKYLYKEEEPEAPTTATNQWEFKG